ncbi:MAG: hypothetical protein JWQ09_5868 [Segetibacter sp.]|nr:hypothetical protein [Segetibacter sp.]
MPTQGQIQQTVYSGQLKFANLVNADRILVSNGFQPKNEGLIKQYQNNVIALNYRLTLGDYISKTTIKIYDCLNSLIGVDTTVNTFDPNFQAPNTTIVVSGGGINAVTLNKTAADLVIDVNGNYYLPFLNNSGVGLPVNSVPVSVLVNGVQIEPALNTTFTPQRLYGFASNVAPQTIVVTVVTLL